jgi:hypothetical protein
MTNGAGQRHHRELLILRELADASRPCATDADLRRAMASAQQITAIQLLLQGAAPLPLIVVLCQGEVAGTAIEFTDAAAGEAESDSATLHAILNSRVPERIVTNGACAVVLVLPSDLMAGYEASDYGTSDYEEHIELVGADAMGRVLGRRGLVRRDDEGLPLSCAFEVPSSPTQPMPPAILAALDLSLSCRSLN